MHKAWIITVDMGYGHQRAAYPLKDIAYERIICANSDNIVEPHEKKEWDKFQSLYEIISRMKSIPLIGTALWKLYSNFQEILPLYPMRDLSKATLSVRYLNKKIKKGFSSSVATYAKKKEIPFVTTFFVPALAASEAGIKDVYCIVTDSDINRIWVASDPKKCNVTYLTPTTHSTKRLIEYGVPYEKIFYTGFPLPEENLRTVKRDMAERLYRLDPKKQFYSRYKEIVDKEVGGIIKNQDPLTITYAVGGAGAQKEYAYLLLKSLKTKIENHMLRINLIAGTRLEIGEYFDKIVKEVGLYKELGKYVNILCTPDKTLYFEEFNKLLRKTDILWTKPSELSFYTALGLPLIMTPAIGAHEEYNKDWILKKSAGFNEENPSFANEWLFEWLDKGMLAESAFNGYTKAHRNGTENIKKIIFSKDPNKLRSIS